MKLLCSSYGKAQISAPKPPDWRGQNWSKISKTFSLKRCNEAHQIYQGNVLNTKMCVVGAKRSLFFTGQKC